MKIQDIQDGLTALGFPNGYAIGGDPAKIVLWEHDAAQPTLAAIAKAAPEGAYLRELTAVDVDRRNAYANESDPLFFQWQAGEATEDAWKAKRAEVAARYPNPEKPTKAKK